jgi:hypothetical protein
MDVFVLAAITALGIPLLIALVAWLQDRMEHTVTGTERADQWLALGLSIGLTDRPEAERLLEQVEQGNEETPAQVARDAERLRNERLDRAA